ncbi:hypothetical protein IFR08_22055 [Pseudomonas fluorescens]|jgi:hypothetical protein|uniref:hypothetical protein n=1 Tax=Pseudomonas TaxID=286 RepID=UPI0010C04468|nr:MULTISPECIES: hypothetical protein [Pseudomonas]MBD8099558.1 hypothetical protein [Pseudomonas fluorescens]MBD8776414.1 hypothetical protein [Pseudomonas fluorescens]MBD8781165.1 hypothetical protein [Pseudomonas fluorescens]MBD8798144.1 hypothetical protein [Pseudomonas fluorescens]TKK30506.1 hypothetical protein PspCFBP13528_15910 [Pseudomonas sp. CFBP13528]
MNSQVNSQVPDFTKRQAVDAEVAHYSQMFFEADRLDALAYEIIESYSGDAAIWARFTETKKSADAQRTAAYREWMRIHRASKK